MKFGRELKNTRTLLRIWLFIKNRWVISNSFAIQKQTFYKKNWQVRGTKRIFINSKQYHEYSNRLCGIKLSSETSEKISIYVGTPREISESLFSGTDCGKAAPAIALRDNPEFKWWIMRHGPKSSAAVDPAMALVSVLVGGVRVRRLPSLRPAPAPPQFMELLNTSDPLIVIDSAHWLFRRGVTGWWAGGLYPLFHCTRWESRPFGFGLIDGVGYHGNSFGR